MRICVYCSSSSAVAEAYQRAARELGALIAARGHSLVYGGGNIGLMGELALAVKAAGGHVLGVIPRRLRDYELAYEEADELIVTESMAERKATMEKYADAYVALPGGFGTLEEILQVITLKQLGYLHAPIVFLNLQGFYDHLLAHFERLYHEHFAKPDHQQLYHVAQTPAEALDYIEGYAESPVSSKWL